MDWTQLALFILSTGGLFLWSRSESRSDCRRIEDLISAIKEEIKDFHGKLCALEEKYKHLNK
jgi:hypothetical protein